MKCQDCQKQMINLEYFKEHLDLEHSELSKQEKRLLIYEFKEIISENSVLLYNCIIEFKTVDIFLFSKIQDEINKIKQLSQEKIEITKTLCVKNDNKKYN